MSHQTSYIGLNFRDTLPHGLINSGTELSLFAFSIVSFIDNSEEEQHNIRSLELMANKHFFECANITLQYAIDRTAFFFRLLSSSAFTKKHFFSINTYLDDFASDMVIDDLQYTEIQKAIFGTAIDSDLMKSIDMHFSFVDTRYVKILLDFMQDKHISEYLSKHVEFKDFHNFYESCLMSHCGIATVFL